MGNTGRQPGHAVQFDRARDPRVERAPTRQRGAVVGFGIQIEKAESVRVETAYFVRGHGARRDAVVQIDRPQPLFRELFLQRADHALAIHRMERLQPALPRRDDDVVRDVLTVELADQGIDDGELQKGGVTRSDEGRIGPDCAQSVVEAADRPLVGELVGDDRGREPRQRLVRGADDDDVRETVRQPPHEMENQRLPVEREQRLGPAHAGTFSAAQDHGGRIGAASLRRGRRHGVRVGLGACSDATTRPDGRQRISRRGDMCSADFSRAARLPCPPGEKGMERRPRIDPLPDLMGEL